MLLKHNNLTIRNATPADALQLEKWWNDGKVMAHAGFPLGSGEKAEEIAESIARDTDESRRLILELDGKPIGEMSYGPVGPETVGLGIKICDFSLHDHGLGKQYLSMLIRWLFETAGYQKVTVDPDKGNRRSRHVYERLGFRQVRVRENAWIDQVGVSRSYVDYELLPEDFVDFASS